MFWRKKQIHIENPRRNKRMQADYLMTYREYSRKDQEPFAVNVKDLSATGTRFVTQEFYREGVDLAIEIMIPPLERVISTRGRVVRIRPVEHSDGLYYVSVRFQDIQSEDAKALDGFIERLARKKGAGFMVDQSKEHWRKPLLAERYDGR